MNPPGSRISALLLAGALLTACSRHHPSEDAVRLPAAAVQVATVRIEDMPGFTEVTGTVRPMQHAMIAAKVMGAIEELPVTLGQRVRAGDLLAKISAGEISARRLQAQSQLNQARRDLERERSLLAKGASTPDMVKSMEDRFAMTQAMVSEAEVMLGYTTILAPFDGVVARRPANAGDLALPGMPLLEIEGTGNFQVEAGIPDSLAARLAVGASLTVEIPATGAGFEGRLVELSSAADPLTHTVPAKLSVPTTAVVRSGQFARVQVPGTPVRALLVPAAAVTMFGQMERVFVVEDGRAGLRLVKTGAVRGNRVEVLAGLADGDRIVVNPPAGLWGKPATGNPAMSATRLSPFPDPAKYGFAGRMASLFIDSKLTPVLVAAALLLGLFAVLMLPREEEPQYKVPMIDVMVTMPGADARDVENRVTRPMEKLLWEIPGVDTYSTASPGGDLTIVRFKVGEDLERSLVKLNQKLQTNFERIPLGVSFPLIKPRTIDDVPILALTFHSAHYDHFTLRRIAAQVDDAIKSIPQVAETTLIGGSRRQIRVQLDPQRLASRNLSAASLGAMLQQANAQTHTGAQEFANQETLLQTGTFFRDARDVGSVVVGVFDGRPVYLRDVAMITDGPEEPANYVLHGLGGASAAAEQPAVTLSVAKRPGANAVAVVTAVLRKVDLLKGTLIPADIGVTITRDYGATASEKSNELLFHMALAIFGVAILILLFLGWRESLVVLLAIPVTLGLTLLVFYLYGYTLNRITLFALIFSIGILVDDAIVVVENIVRHMSLPGCRRKRLIQIAVEAVDEVGNPTVLATGAVIAAVLPMAFVSGLMGPYMRPIPVGATAAMLFSLLVAFAVTPWAALKMLRGHARPAGPAAEFVDIPLDEDEDAGGGHAPETMLTRLYRRIMGPMIAHRAWRWGFLAVVAGLAAGSLGLIGFGAVKVKMLPFDNKSEFQVILNMPEGSTLEQTARVAREMAAALRSEPEVRDYQVYAGTASPFNFNGLVRHYFMRRGASVAEPQVNLRPGPERSAQSHDIARRIRPRLAAIAAKYAAAVAVAEVPPGPPVLQTLVAEIYGPTEEARLKLATRVRDIFHATRGVVDVDWYVEELQSKAVFHVDKEKAALHGITEAAIARTVQMAVQGYPVTLLHAPGEREDVNVILELPRALRVRPDDLLALPIRAEASALNGAEGPLVPLRELVTVEQTHSERNIYHKNLQNVTYVTGDVAGVIESPVYAILQMNRRLAELDGRDFGGSQPRVKIYNASMPFDDREPAMKWDGEWQVTIEVFRDLGLAFGAVCILIYMLMVGWFKNYTTPLIIMSVIPLSLIGILPAHGLLGAFFTATSMIGFMAGAGIVVRNGIILVDFIELRLRQGLPLAEAVVDAGAVRFRPMLLTALAVMVGAAVILRDPIFQGLALSLMAGEVASLLISRFAVPVIYYMAHARKHEKPAPAVTIAGDDEKCVLSP